MTNIAIQTTDWTIRPDTSEEPIADKKGRFFKQNIIPLSPEAASIINDVYTFKLLPGKPQPEKLPDYYYLAGLIGDEYIIEKKHYPLNRYYMLCAINELGGVVPLLRGSCLDEKWISVDKELRQGDVKQVIEASKPFFINYWPIINKIEKTEKPIDPQQISLSQKEIPF